MIPSPTTEKPKGTNLTQRQIAEVVGVSRQLVGFALRGEGRMTDEMRQQILEMARVNGCNEFSNGAARSMAARRYGKRAATGVMESWPFCFRRLSRGNHFTAFPTSCSFSKYRR